MIQGLLDSIVQGLNNISASIGGVSDSLAGSFYISPMPFSQTGLSRAFFILIVLFLVIVVFLLLRILVNWAFEPIPQKTRTRGLSQAPQRSAEEGDGFRATVRGKWGFYPAQLFEFGQIEFQGKKPLLLGYVVEKLEEVYTLYFGADEVWYRFINPTSLTDSAKISLLRILKEKWLQAGGVEITPELARDQLSLNLHNWKTVLRELVDNRLPKDTEFSWNGFLWKVEEFLGTFRVDVDGNHFFQGKELVALYLLKSRDKLSPNGDEKVEYPDKLYLISFVIYTGGREHMGGKVSMWDEGEEVSSEEVEKWIDQEVEVSSALIEAGLYD